MDDEQAAAARRKIALYREYLARGAEAALARAYLGEIAELQHMLDKLERGKSGPSRARQPSSTTSGAL